MFDPQDPDCQACACDIQRDTAIGLLREVEKQLVANLSALDVLAFVRGEIAKLSPPKTATVPVTLPPP